MATKRRQIVVVKNLKESTSPKRTLLVSRRPIANDFDDILETSNFGNSSPAHPIRSKDGNVMARSVLGDPAVYDSLEKRDMSAEQECNPGTGAGMTPMRSGTGNRSMTPMRNGTGARNMTPGRMSMSANGAPGSPGPNVPIESEAEVYFKTLNLRKETAAKARAKDKEMGETLASYLPMKERFALAKEKNVMTLWQERQLQWQRIQQHIQAKCNAPPSHALMMTTTDEFRVKAEQYDVLQAAIPTVERFGPDSWQMQLRGGTSKVCTIGHIFSGLECELKSDRKAPIIVRRPRPVVANTYTQTASGIIGSGTESTVAIMTKRPGTIDDSSAMKAKKRRLKAHLKRIRPHSVTMEMAEGLLLRSQPLFHWAEQSSTEYYQDQEERERLAEEEQEMGGSLSSRQEKETKALQATRVADDRNRAVKNMPTLSFAASTELVFSTNVGETTHQYVEFTNTGPIALNYSWRVDPTKYPVAAALAAAKSLRKTCLERDPSKVTRESLLSSQRTSFFCQRDCGKILPGETIVTCFSYCNKSGGGVVNQSWLLDTVPRAMVTLQQANDSNTGATIAAGGVGNEIGSLEARVAAVKLSSAGSNATKSSASSASSSPKSNAIETEVPLCVNFRGHTNNVDYKLTQRTKSSKEIDECARTAYITDTLYQSVRRVRDPIRTSTIDARQKSLFADINDVYLRSKSPRYGSILPYFITNDRIRDFISYYHEATEGFEDLQQKLFAIVNKSKRFSDIIVKDQDGTSLSMDALETRELVLIAQEKEETIASLARAQALFFPEQQLDNFDEVSSDDVALKWGMDVEALSRRCRANKDRATYFVDIEQQLSVFLKEEEKQQAKARKIQEKLARQTARNGKKKRRQEEDSDEEEEEEEEEEDEDEAAAALAAENRRLRHPEIVRSTRLMNQCNALISLCFVRPSSSALVNGAGRELLLRTLDAMDTENAAARERAKWDPDSEFTAFKCPFNTMEGKTSWTEALTGGHAAGGAGGGGGAHGGTKGGGKEAALAVPQQIDMIYRDMHSHVNEQLLSGLTDIFCQVDVEHRKNMIDQVVQTTQSIFTKSQLRVEDTKGQNKVVFINFDGDAFTAGTTRNRNNNAQQTQLSNDLLDTSTSGFILSAFDESLNRQQRALNAAYQCGINNAHAVVLLYEDTCADKTSGGVPSTGRPLTKACGTISNLLNERETKRKAAYDGLSARKQKKLLLEKGLQPVVQVTFDVVPCTSFAELRLTMQKFLQSDTYKGQPKGTTIVPVFVLETIQYTGVVPPEPELVEYVSDDEDAPLTAIGQQEYKQNEIDIWKARRPHRVEVIVPVISAQALNAVNQKRLSNVNSVLTSTIFSDAKAAVEEIIREAHAGTNSSALFVDACPSALLMPRKGALQSVKTGSETDSCPRILSSEMRELLLWCAVCKYIPVLSTPEVLASHPLVAAHYQRLFQHSHLPTAITTPRMLFVAGGAVRIEKFRLLDEMLDMAGTVCIVGELAIPFIAASNALIQMTRYSDLCADHFHVCKQLIAKARYRGVKLVLPSDLTVGEESLNYDDWFKCVDKIEKDARDEGGDYEEEIKVVSLIPQPRQPEPPPVVEGEGAIQAAASAAAAAITALVPPGFEPVVTQGYIYDIGPESCKALVSEVQSCDLLLVWGTVGVCEVSTFQTGQRALVNASVHKVSEEAQEKEEAAAAAAAATAASAAPSDHKKATKSKGGKDTHETKTATDATKAAATAAAAATEPTIAKAVPSQTLVIGDTAVEWYSRITDPEGEYNGNIQQAGFVAYAQRMSGLFTGLLSQYTLPFVSDVDNREPVEQEFVYDVKEEVVEEEEEEEEDDDDEEEEDDDY